MWSHDTPTAAVLIIGNEILSGQVQDANLVYIATRLGELGIRLKETRMVEDVEEDIIDAVLALCARYTHVFTTGGIGPTHDDITAVTMAKAFGRPLCCSLEALDRLKARYPNPQAPEALTRMTVMPAGAALIDNTVSAAPGFQLENVFVMAGIPSIAKAMFEAAVPRLSSGPARYVREVVGEVVEGAIAQGLEDLDTAYPGIEIGSYPYWYSETNHGVRVIIKGLRLDEVEAVEAKIIVLMGAHPGYWAAARREP